MQKITPCLWYDKNAEEAVNYYLSIFKNSRLLKTSYYDEDSAKASGQPAGSVLTLDFELNGQRFVALNGGPIFKFSEAVSFVVNCESEEELDEMWEKLSAGGDPTAQQCGWLKDKFGLSWQIVPKELEELLGDPDPAKAQRTMQAMLQMKKLDINLLKKAHAGK